MAAEQGSRGKSSKFQAPTSRKAPSAKHQACRLIGVVVKFESGLLDTNAESAGCVWSFKLGTSLGVGAWFLVLQPVCTFANLLRFKANTPNTNPVINPSPIKFSRKLGGNTRTKPASLTSAAKLDTQNGIR